ncbi:hypothetical protein LBBP_00315 [Leptospira borgpetersenii serovar Ballum]|uniref:Uncharacterized protein n=1 Tax=Leptospira borgpetersenii serovar Ballum TaxID=280505 RepID=A0A0S2IM02_LEPBO|nr:hypothetical protein LBBP_00315 [Leptospira borgpetersenii serovar Ballum]
MIVSEKSNALLKAFYFMKMLSDFFNKIYLKNSQMNIEKLFGKKHSFL